MLALTRRLNQSICIDDDLEIVVVDVRVDQVRLGINAPKDVAVHRQEVWMQIQEEKQTNQATDTGQ